MVVERVMPVRAGPAVDAVVHDLRIVRLPKAPAGHPNWEGRFTFGPEGFGAAVDAVAAEYDLEDPQP